MAPSRTAKLDDRAPRPSRRTPGHQPRRGSVCVPLARFRWEKLLDQSSRRRRGRVVQATRAALTVAGSPHFSADARAARMSHRSGVNLFVAQSKSTKAIIGGNGSLWIEGSDEDLAEIDSVTLHAALDLPGTGPHRHGSPEQVSTACAGWGVFLIRSGAAEGRPNDLTRASAAICLSREPQSKD